MKRLLLVFLVACGSTPSPKPLPKPLPPKEPRDSVIVIPTPEPRQEYDTIPVIMLYTDTLLRTGIYGVAAMDGYEVNTTPVTHLDTEKEPIYKSYLVWQTRRR